MLHCAFYSNFQMSAETECLIIFAKLQFVRSAVNLAPFSQPEVQNRNRFFVHPHFPALPIVYICLLRDMIGTLIDMCDVIG